MVREWKVEGGAAKPVYVVNPAVLEARYFSITTPIVGTMGTSVFGTAGRVYISPMDVPWPVMIDRIIYGTGVSQGNVRAGIYREGATPDSPVGAELVVESASVAMPGANRLHFVPVPETLLVAGQYFIGLQGDDVAASFNRWVEGASAIAFLYDHAYGPFTDPCPALTVTGLIAAFWIRVSQNLPV